MLSIPIFALSSRSAALAFSLASYFSTSHHQPVQFPTPNSFLYNLTKICPFFLISSAKLLIHVLIISHLKCCNFSFLVIKPHPHPLFLFRILFPKSSSSLTAQTIGCLFSHPFTGSLHPAQPPFDLQGHHSLSTPYLSSLRSYHFCARDPWLFSSTTLYCLKISDSLRWLCPFSLPSPMLEQPSRTCISPPSKSTSRCSLSGKMLTF